MTSTGQRHSRDRQPAEQSCREPRNAVSAPRHERRLWPALQRPAELWQRGRCWADPSRRWYRHCWGRRLGRVTLVHFAEMADVRSSRWCRRCRFWRAALIDNAKADRPAWSSSRGEMSSRLNSRAGHDDGRVVEQRLLDLRRRGSDEDEGGCSAPKGGATDAAEDVSCNKKSSETH